MIDLQYKPYNTSINEFEHQTEYLKTRDKVTKNTDRSDSELIT